MKILKNKKALSSVAAILVALALIAGSTMAWFVIEGGGIVGGGTAGYLDFEVKFNADPETVWEAGDPGSVWPMYADADTLATLYTETELNQMFGWIENTGNLSILIKLGSVLQTKVFWDCPDRNLVRPVIANRVEARGGTGPSANMTANPTGYVLPAEDNGVLGSLWFPPTPQNLEMAVNGMAIYESNGDWYLFLDPGAWVHVALGLDWETNADHSVRDNPDPAISRKYIDALYMGAQVSFAEDYGWLATQGNYTQAWVDEFGIDLFTMTAYDLLATGEAFDLGTAFVINF